MKQDKRCPFSGRVCYDACALHDDKTSACAIQRIADELYFLAEAAMKQARMKQPEQGSGESI